MSRGGEDNSIALVFIHESVMESLNNCTILFMDGTFDVSVYSELYLKKYKE
jgi:hypothetical protein